jgi:hypothetical protein
MILGPFHNIFLSFYSHPPSFKQWTGRGSTRTLMQTRTVRIQCKLRATLASHVPHCPGAFKSRDMRSVY